MDLRVTKHHNIVSTTVDISLLHDDLPGDHPTVGCREVDFTLESRFDDRVLCLQNLIGTWVKLRHQDVHIICIHRIGTLGCCSLKLQVSYELVFNVLSTTQGHLRTKKLQVKYCDHIHL